MPLLAFRYSAWMEKVIGNTRKLWLSVKPLVGRRHRTRKIKVSEPTRFNIIVPSTSIPTGYRAISSLGLQYQGGQLVLVARGCSSVRASERAGRPTKGRSLWFVEFQSICMVRTTAAEEE